MKHTLLHAETTDLILKAYFNVYNTLGYGFLGKVYENALLIELKNMGLKAQRQVPLKSSTKNKWWVNIMPTSLSKTK